MKRSRDERALKRKSTFGREVAAGEWAISEWGALVRLWNLGLPVPYPVQIDGTEILMEWITVDGGDRARGWPRPGRSRRCCSRTSTSCATRWPRWCRPGSSTATSRRTTSWRRATRLVIIDLPQIVDLVGNQNGMDFLMRDCANICGWFRGKGLEVDEHELFGELMAHAF